MDQVNTAFEMQENEVYPKPPGYENIVGKGGRSVGGVVDEGCPCPKASKSLKCILILIWIAISVNFLLIIGAGAVMYNKYSELDGQNSPIVRESAGSCKNNVSGPPGPPGLQGERGLKGDSGDQGLKGNPGDPGVTGPQGPSGLNGVPGHSGVTGPQGQKGEKGSEGATGQKGLKGDMGVQGPLGTAGAIGPQGQKGEKGSQGVQGLKGMQGPLGPAGAAGPKGQKGEMGSQGATGTQGLTGPPGTAQGGVTYTRWGNSTCPSVSGTQLVYSGYAAGSFYSQKGSGANYICAPTNPQYGQFLSGFQGRSLLYGAEYEFPIVGTHEHNVPCAVCLATTRGAMHMFPARNSCPTSWTLEYTGWLMSGHHAFHRSMYECVDQSQESLPGSFQNTNEAIFSHVEVDCGYGLPCPPYVEEKELLCVVCTK